MNDIITSLEHLHALKERKAKIVCLFSGGLDGAYLLSLLSRLNFTDVIALTVDVGGEFDSQAAVSVCKRFGYPWAPPHDLRQEFAREFIAPAIAAQATYLGGHPLCASLSRPCIAREAVRLARERGYDVILHTSTRSQNSLRRFNGAIRSLGFEGAYGSIYEQFSVTREKKIEELNSLGIPFYQSRLYSIDENLWGRGVESSGLDDPECVDIQGRDFQDVAFSNRTQRMEILFEHGVPVALDGRRLDLVSLLEKVRQVGESYALGRYIGLEEIIGEVKVQEFHDMPAAAILLDAYHRIESASLSAECIREKRALEQIWVREATEGRWFDALRLAADAFIQTLAKKVSGKVVYDISYRSLQIKSLIADKPLYIRDRARFERVSKLGGA